MLNGQIRTLLSIGHWVFETAGFISLLDLPRRNEPRVARRR
jgi:hypothetical protein